MGFNGNTRGIRVCELCLGGYKFGDMLDESGVGVKVSIEEFIKRVCELDECSNVEGCGGCM